MKTIQLLKVLLVFVVLLNASLSFSQLDSKAIQRSSIVKSTPYECQGFVLLHQTTGVEMWQVIATKSDPNVIVLPTEVFQSDPGFDHLRLPKSIWNDSDYSYKIQGLDGEGKIVVEEDHNPPADPNNLNVHSLNDCNRPTCNAEDYAYSILIYSHLDENLTNYYLKLGNAWTGYTEAGIEIPYYQRVLAIHLQTYIDQRSLQDNGFDYYQDPDDGAYYFVKKDRGPWKNVDIITGELVGTEECFLTYTGAEQTLNSYGVFSGSGAYIDLQCNGQVISSNETSGGSSGVDGNPNITDYEKFIDCIWDETYSDNGFSLIELWDCWDDVADPTGTGPCPEGFYYSPGGGDPCVQIENIIVHPLDLYGQDPAAPESFSLKDKIVRKKPNRSEINNHVFPKGLYSIAVKLDNGIYIPFLKSYKEDFTLLSVPETDIRLKQQDFSVYPNPMNIGVDFTIQAELESEYPYNYTITDSKNGAVLAEGNVAYGQAVQCKISSNSNIPITAIIGFTSNDPEITGEATKHVLIKP